MYEQFFPEVLDIEVSFYQFDPYVTFNLCAPSNSTTRSKSNPNYVLSCLSNLKHNTVYRNTGAWHTVSVAVLELFYFIIQIADEYHEDLDQHMSELFTQSANLTSAGGLRPNPHSMPNIHTTRFPNRDEGGLAGLASARSHDTSSANGGGSAKARIQVSQACLSLSYFIN